MCAFLLAVTACTVVCADTPSAISTEADQKDVAITVYNNGLALVRDTRDVKLPNGEASLQFMDVAQQIQPATVGLRSTSAPGTVAILEQNYEFDLISPSKLMEKFVGKRVKLINFSNEVNFEQMEAELLSVNEGPIYKVNNEIYLGYPGNVVLPEVPENLIAKPSLIWLLANQGTDQTLQVTYLTNGISWSADYVVTLAKDEKKLDVSGWVTMNNECGATFANAQLKLVAGDVNIAQPPPVVMEKLMRGVAAEPMAPPMPQEEAFAEYHLYTMPRRTTIKQNQSKQLALLTGSGVQCAKKYEYRGQMHFYSQPIGRLPEEKVGVFLEFENKEAKGLGIPLPAGVMRIYQEDSEGMLQFSGEDRIKHTPKDEKITLKLGNAFDIVAERVQTDFKQLADRLTESSFEITIRNHKELDVSVDIVEPMSSDWQIVTSSIPHKKKDAQTAIFTVPVPKDGETKLTYTARVKW
jgi:hypothetical protein